MRTVLILLLLAGLCAPCRATVRYVSEGGGVFSGGTQCNGQTAISRATYNVTTNLGGDLVYLCGTLAGPITPVGNGAGLGSLVTILFDTGASITVTACGASGCINLQGHSYFLVAGLTGPSGCGWNGLLAQSCADNIIATGNGTGSGNGESLGVNLTGGANNITIQKLGITNMYVHTGSGNDTPPNNYYAISIVGTSIAILNNTIHDAAAGIVMNVTTTAITISNNEIYNVNWGVFGSGSTTVNGITNITVNQNSVHDFQNWDTTSDFFHHDGIFFAGNNNAANTVAGVDIYGNYIWGTVSDPTVCTTANNSCMTAYIFVNDANHVRTYNNILVPDAGGIQSVSNGWIFYWSPGTLQSNSLIANNTVIGNAATQSPVQGACIVVRGDASMTFQNNIMQGCANLIWTYTTPTTTFTALSNNIYQKASLTNAWKQDGATTYNTLVAWQTAIGADAASQATTGSLSLGSFQQPAHSSIATGTGANLTGLGFTNLNSDYNLSARPGVAAWDVGAWNAAAAPAVGKAPIFIL